MAKKSKAFAAFGDSFSKSLMLGTQIGLRQQQLGAEMAWRENQEKTRKEERAESIARQDKRYGETTARTERHRAEDLARGAKTRAAEVAYRTKRDETQAEQFGKTQKFRAEQSRLARALKRDIAKTQAGTKGMDRWRAEYRFGGQLTKNVDDYIKAVWPGANAKAYGAAQILNKEVTKMMQQKPISRDNMSEAVDMLESAISGKDAGLDPRAREEAMQILGTETLAEYMD